MLFVASVGPSPASEDLVNTAARRAREAGARLVVVCVETWLPGTLSAGDGEQLRRNLETARDLGAEVVSLPGDRSGRALVDYARSRGAGRILVGLRRNRGLFGLARPPFGLGLGRPGDPPVDRVPTKPLDALEESEARHWWRLTAGQGAAAAVILGFGVAAALTLRIFGAPGPVPVLAILLAVVAAAGSLGLTAGVLVSILAVVSLNYWFTEPLYTLWVNDPWNWLVFFLVLAIGLLVGLQTSRLDYQARLRRNRERRLELLYRLGRRLATAGSESAVAEAMEPFRRTVDGALLESFGLLEASALERIRRTREAQAGLFLQGISHDWRTPLSVMAGAAESLDREAGGRLTADELRRLRIIRDEALGLGHQLENVLELSRAEDPSLALGREWIPAEELLYSCRDASAGQPPVEVLVPAGLPMVSVDVPLVSRALMNLVDNACRYAPDSPSILLSFTPREGGGEFGVADRGPGVAPDEREFLFDKFRRGEGARGVRGSGLGLALVRQTARLHGGEAGIRDREGGGTFVWFTVAG